MAKLKHRKCEYCYIPKIKMAFNFTAENCMKQHKFCTNPSLHLKRESDTALPCHILNYLQCILDRKT